MEGAVIVNLASPSRRGSGRLFETPEEYTGYRVLDPKGRQIAICSHSGRVGRGR
jgi:hypothetical protein